MSHAHIAFAFKYYNFLALMYKQIWKLLRQKVWSANQATRIVFRGQRKVLKVPLALHFWHILHFVQI